MSTMTNIRVPIYSTLTKRRYGLGTRTTYTIGPRQKTATAYTSLTRRNVNAILIDYTRYKKNSYHPEPFKTARLCNI